MLASAFESCDTLKGRMCGAVSAGLRPDDTVSQQARFAYCEACYCWRTQQATVAVCKRPAHART